MAKGDLKILLTVETKQLKAAMNNVASSISNLNKSSSRKLKNYKKEMDEIVQKSRALEQHMEAFFKTPQKGGYWKKFIKETQNAREEINKALNAFDEKGVVKLNFDYNRGELDRVVNTVESKIGNISGSGNKVLAKYNQNIEEVIQNSKQLQQATKEAFSSPQNAKTWVAYTAKLNEQMEKVSTTVEDETQRAFRDLRYELIQTSKIANQSMSTEMFQDLYKETKQGTIGLEKMNQRLIELRDSGFLTNRQFADLNRKLVNLGTKSKQMEKIILASREWNSVLDKNIRRVARLRAKFGSYVDLVTRSVYKVNFLMTQAAQQLHTLALYVGSVMAAFGGLKVIDEFEKLDVTLQKVTGSMKEYSESWKFIKEFARDAPQNIREVSDAFIKLKAYGLEPTNGMLRAIIDTVAALGGDAKTLNSIARAFGQIQAKGRLMGQEVRQLADANIPIYTILNEKLGITKDEIDDIGNQAITANEALAAMQSWLEEAYGGTAAARMDTLSGRLSNLGDVVSTFLYDISKSGGASDYLKNQIKGLTDAIANATEDPSTVRKWGRVLNNTFRALVEGFKIGLKEIKQSFSEGSLGVITDFIGKWIGKLRNQSKSAEEFIGKLIATLVKLKVYLISFMGFGVIAGIASALASLAERALSATKRIGQLVLGLESIKKLNLSKGLGVSTLAANIRKLAGALKYLLVGNPIGLVIAAIVVLVRALWKYVPEFRASMKQVGGSLIEIGKELLPMVGKAFKVFGVVVNTALGAIAMTAVYVFGVLKGIFRLLSGDLSGAIDAVQEGYERMVKVGENITKTNDEIWSGITQDTKEARKELTEIGKKYENLLKPLKKYEPVKELLGMARVNESYKAVEGLVGRMKELKIIKEDVEGKLTLNIGTQGYKNLTLLLSKGKSLNEALSTLEVRANMSKGALNELYGGDSGGDSSTSPEDKADKITKALEKLTSAAKQAKDYLTFSFDNDLLNANQVLKRTTTYYNDLVNKLRSTNIGTDKFRSVLGKLRTTFAEVKIKVFTEQISQLQNKIEKSKEKIEKYGNEYKNYASKVDAAIKDINDTIYNLSTPEEKMEITKQNIIKLQDEYRRLGYVLSDLYDKSSKLMYLRAKDFISEEEYNKEQRANIKEIIDTLLSRKKVIKDLISEQQKLGKLSEEDSNEYIDSLEQIKTRLQSMKTALKEINNEMVKNEEDKIKDTKKRIDGLEDKIKKLNKVVAGIKEAEINAIVNDEQLQKLIGDVDKLDGSEITITANIKENIIQAKRYGGEIKKKFATGGWLPGYGGGDKIKALLEAGEFVVRKEAVKKFGLGFLQAVNNMTLPTIKPPVAEAPKSTFATGGMATNVPQYGTVNLVINNEQFPVMTEKQVADKLMKYLNKQKRVSL